MYENTKGLRNAKLPIVDTAELAVYLHRMWFLTGKQMRGPELNELEPEERNRWRKFARWISERLRPIPPKTLDAIDAIKHLLLCEGSGCEECTSIRRTYTDWDNDPSPPEPQ